MCAAPAARVAAALLVALALLASGGGPVSRSAAAQTTPMVELKFGLQRTMAIAAVFVGLEKGYFAQEGIDLKLEPLTAGSDILTQVGVGYLHAGTGSGAVLYNAFNRGLDLKVLAATQFNNPNGPATNTVVVRSDLLDSSAVSTAADLRGRRVGVNARGVASEYAVDLIMREASATVDDVDLVVLPFPDMPTALANGSLDAAFVTEPYLRQAEKLGAARPIAPNSPAGEQITVLFVNSAYSRANPGVEVGLVTGILRASRDLYGEGWNQPENVEILSKYTQLPPDVIQDSVKPYVDPNGRIDLDALDRQQRYFLAHGMLQYSEPIPVANMVDQSSVEDALRRLGEFVPHAVNARLAAQP
jgi:NitT/TauT family transport system substrate-binding protein